ncbi:MAG: PQQ-like beta-propeller repeat protein [Candidatus Poribacteria bacterium]|nr:PQQ-like beta-propeller repeat protein [Candidatus Poribacteria bacterium]
MKKTTILTICLCVLAMLAMYTIQTIADQHATKTEHTSNYENNWHHWRGPHTNGVAVNANPPLTWSESENIRWKVPIPGLGHATPIIWEDKIFIQTAIKVDKPAEEEKTENTEESDSVNENPFSGFLPQNQRDRQRGEGIGELYQFKLIAYNRSDGSILWEKTLKETEPHEGMHNHSSFASNSPVTDGEYIYAYFGSRGLYCLDMKGNIKWEKDLGQMRKAGTFGEGSCPIIHEDAIVILRDQEGQSFIVALNKHSGDEIWKKERNERTTWTSPIVVEHNGKSQIIVPATNRTRSYDLENGDVLWECSGMTRNVIPSPVYTDGHVYVISGFRGSSLQAIDLDIADGDITGTDAIVWEYNRDTPYVPSPLLSGDIIYFLKDNNGILTAIDKNTGMVHYGPERVTGISGVYSSIAGAADRVYIASRNGTVTVLKHGPEFEVLAVNKLDDSFNASPVFVGDELFLRGAQHLYCIAE